MPSISDPGDRRGDVMSRFEFEDELLRDGFTSMPNTVLYYSGISMGAKATYLVLLSYAWDKMRAWPGQETMADQLGIGVRTIRNYLKELEAHGIIKIKQRGLTMTSDVVFLRLGHLRAAKSAAQGRQAPRTPRAAESARPERHKLPTNNDTGNTTKGDPLPDQDPAALWHDTLTWLRTAMNDRNWALTFEHSEAVGFDGDVLRVQVRDQHALREIQARYGPLVGQVLGEQKVKFES